MTTIDDITRRLLGRHVITIDRVTGIPGRAPAITVTFSDEDGLTSYNYDTIAEYWEQLDAARDFAANCSDTHDIVDNTL